MGHKTFLFYELVTRSVILIVVHPFHNRGENCSSSVPDVLSVSWRGTLVELGDEGRVTLPAPFDGVQTRVVSGTICHTRSIYGRLVREG